MGRRAEAAREKKAEKDRIRRTKEAQEQMVADMITARQKKQEANDEARKRAATAKRAADEETARRAAKAKEEEEAKVKREGLEGKLSRLEKVWKLADANTARLEEQGRQVKLQHEQQPSSFAEENLRRHTERTDTARTRAKVSKDNYDQCLEQLRALPVSAPKRKAAA